eukprot:CAMPEP_0194393748 /NCGR_PEP_ID=MMETSP0174-20130528/123470_1 /TAXON_ID=216777 /ORGANISM="Proboscia alata, Strain PI-D3" /LENGTH=720 /DNA_ID=CAMNT_0039189467 /DNA_START=59 /DNA_END=2221 /DNA_ORIENTATION=+
MSGIQPGCRILCRRYNFRNGSTQSDILKRDAIGSSRTHNPATSSSRDIVRLFSATTQDPLKQWYARNNACVGFSSPSFVYSSQRFYASGGSSGNLSPLSNALIDKSSRNLIRLLDIVSNKGKNDSPVTVTTEQCNRVLQSLQQNAAVRGAAKRATLILHKMTAVQSKNTRTLANNESFALVIYGWQNSDDNSHARNAEAVLNLWSECARSKTATDATTMVTVTDEGMEVVLKCWCRSGAHDAHTHVQTLLARMESPSLEAYREVISLLTARGNVSEACRVLMNLEDSYYVDGHPTPNTACYQPIIDASRDATQSLELLQRMQRMRRHGNTRIDISTHLYNSILSGLAQNGSIHATRQAEEILNEMIQQSKSDVSMRPDVTTYSAVMRCMIAGGAVAKADGLLTRLESSYQMKDPAAVRPTTEIYNMVLEAHATSRGTHEELKRSVVRCEDILHQLVTHTNSTDSADAQQQHWHYKPNAVTFKHVLRAHSRLQAHATSRGTHEELKRSVVRCEDILHHLLTHTNSTDSADAQQQHWHYKPNAVTFKHVLRAHSRLRNFTRSNKILQLYASFTPPDIHAYNMVLRSCITDTNDAAKRREALAICVGTVQKATAYTPPKNAHPDDPEDVTFDMLPNSLTYQLFFQAMAQFLPEDNPKKLKLAEKMLWQACDYGIVNQSVLQALRDWMGSSNSYRGLLERVTGIEGVRTIHDFPEEFTTYAQQD